VSWLAPAGPSSGPARGAVTGAAAVLTEAALVAAVLVGAVLTVAAVVVAAPSGAASAARGRETSRARIAALSVILMSGMRDLYPYLPGATRRPGPGACPPRSRAGR
jgi:hypothetical protein